MVVCTTPASADVDLDLDSLLVDCRAQEGRTNDVEVKIPASYSNERRFHVVQTVFNCVGLKNGHPR